MSKSKRKPTRWYYILALIIPIFACMATTLLVYRSVPKLPGALDTLGTKNLKQVVVPGSAEINFLKPGAYAVYYEYHSVIDGVSYFRDEYPPNIRCQLRAKVTGETVKLAPSNVEGNVYTTQYPERAGVLFKRISIDQPGDYTFSCQYPDGRAYPKNVMAVGPNLVLEFFNVAFKPIAAILFGSFAFVSACGMSILIIGFVAFKRHRSKNNLTSVAERDGAK
jgi:hypothetical protein